MFHAQSVARQTNSRGVGATVKCHVIHADLRGMPSFLAMDVHPQDVWILVPAIALWLVFTCLKAIAEDIEYAVRCRKLHLEADQLRERQTRRLKELGIKRRH